MLAQWFTDPECIQYPPRYASVGGAIVTKSLIISDLVGNLRIIEGANNQLDKG